MSEKISNKPDPIDKLLNRIIKEAEMEANFQYASFVQRLIARLIDTAIVLSLSFIIQQSAVSFIKSDNLYNVEFILRSLDQAVPALAIMIWVLVYSPVMESTGGTLGKRIVGIQLLSEQTLQVPAFRFCFGRTWLYLVFIVLALIPSIVSGLAVLFSDKKQAWHDKMTGMVCVVKS
jgi:uncharacterized RDD family membrane protein YckC